MMKVLVQEELVGFMVPRDRSLASALKTLKTFLRRRDTGRTQG